MLEGLVLMGFGMGFVFVFLTVLVLTTKAMSAFMIRYVPAAELLVNQSSDDMVPLIASDTRLIAVLAVAVHRFRQDQK
jgi:oxaloacetate decarboxylase gamma subunit